MNFAQKGGRSGVLLLGLVSSTYAAAFETATHTAMTASAVAVSSLGGQALHKQLGLVDYNFALGSRYLDLGGSVIARNSQTYDSDVLASTRAAEGLSIPQDFTIAGWVMRGAIREDDNTKETPSADEPGGVFRRVFGHFFDPVNNRGLTTGIPQGATAVDWALLSTATADGRMNHFKISDANEAIWRAVTLKRSDGNGGFNDDVWPTNVGTMSSEELRKAYWASAFRSLGDAVHLLQDMGQPQHTRNDAHSGYGCTTVGVCAAGHASFFENYLLARTLQTGQFFLSEGMLTTTPGDAIKTTANQLTYIGYGKPSFPTFREYYGTYAPTIPQNAAAKGLANYSNRNFYSFGQKPGFPGTEYPSPSPTGAGLTETTIAIPESMTGVALEGPITFKVGSAYDAATDSSTPGVKMLAVGLWDQFLKEKNLLFSSNALNYYVYNDQADLLVPRAVGYSAGLIDFFFRGKLAVTPAPEGVYGIVDHSSKKAADSEGFTKIKLNVANATDTVAGVEQAMSGGMLAVVVKFHRNKCYTESLSGEWGSPDIVASKGAQVFESPDDGGCRSDNEEIVVSNVRNGVSLTATPQPFEFSFSPNPIPINASDVSLQVVYRGALGQESDSVVVETLDIGEPYFVAYMNATDYAFCYNGTWKMLGANAQYPADVLQGIPDANTRYPVLPITDLSVGYGSSTGSGFLEIARASSIPPGKYIRYAVLADLGVDWSVIFDIGTSPFGIDHNNHPTDLSLTANQVYLRFDETSGELLRSPRARKVTKVRKHYAAGGAFVHYQHGETPCSVDALIPLESDGIPVPELLPTEIVGFFGP